MATIPFVVEIPRNQHGGNIPGAYIVTWGPLANGDDGAPFVCPNKSDKSVQVLGTFGAGGNARIEGSNKQAYNTSLSGGASAGLGASDYATLNDPQANALDFTSAKIEQVLENPNAIRPRVTAGDGTTSLTVVMTVTATQLAF